MKRVTTKILLLFLTFFVGVTAYYIYYLSNSSVEEKRFHSPEVLNVASEKVPNDLEEAPKESTFHVISPCDEANSFKEYSARTKQTISGGVVNHRVKCGVLPEYPQAKSNIPSTVTVYVLIDQFGEVEDAGIMNGHRLLNKSVLRAARKTQFAPFILRGEPVEVRGVLIYKFEAGKAGLQKMKMPPLIPPNKSMDASG